MKTHIFSWDEYQTGKYKIQTRNGYTVTQLHKFDKPHGHCIFGVVGDQVIGWFQHGHRCAGMLAPDDLVLVDEPKTVTRWVNVYRWPDGTYRFGRVPYRSEEDGKRNPPHPDTGAVLVATVEVEWED